MIRRIINKALKSKVRKDTKLKFNKTMAKLDLLYGNKTSTLVQPSHNIKVKLVTDFAYLGTQNSAICSNNRENMTLIVSTNDTINNKKTTLFN